MDVDRRFLACGSLLLKLVVLLQLLQHAARHMLQLAQAAALSAAPLGQDDFLLWRVAKAATAITAPLSSLAPAAAAAAASAGTWLAAHPAAAALLLAGLAWLAAEAAFHLLWYRPQLAAWNGLRSSMACPAGLTPADSAALFARFMRVCRECPCDEAFLAEYLSTWFKGAAVSEIHRGNMEELFSYGFYYKNREQMQAAGLGHLPSQMACEFEAAFGLRLPPGHNPALSFMSHLWEDLRVHPRPLAFYAATEALGLLAAGVMTALGFRRGQHGPLCYYTRNLPNPGASRPCSQPKEEQPTPVVFMHGVVGLVLYLPLVGHLAASGAPLVVLDMRHVGLRLCRTIPSIDSLTAALAAVLRQLALPPATVMAHSYGTLVASRLLRLHRPAVAKLVLVDPVAAGMFMPRLLHGFLYARPSLRSLLSLRSPLAALQQVMLPFVSRDIHLAATFSRGFWWSDLNLWPEDLPAGSCVLLGGADALVQAPELAAMLQLGNPAIKVILKDGLIHGGFMLQHSTRAAVIREATAAVAAAAVAAAAGTAAAAAAAGEAVAAAAEGACEAAGAASSAAGTALACAGEGACQAAAAAAGSAAAAVEQLAAHVAPDASDTCPPADQGSAASATTSSSRRGCKHARSSSADSAVELEAADCDALCKPVAAVRGSFATRHHASDSASSLLDQDQASLAASDCSSSKCCGSWLAETAAAGAPADSPGAGCSRDWQGLVQQSRQVAC